MLLQFSVDNFLSIKDKVVFSMNETEKSEKNTLEVTKSGRKDFRLLNSAVLYGANGSGKSNLLKAMARMRSIVLNEEKVMLSTDSLAHNPFLLSTETQNASTTFEIVFFINENKIRYGFDFDEKNIYAEWLFVDKAGKEARFFIRDDEDSYVNPRFKEGYVFFDKKSKNINIPKNQLFLWKCDQNSSDLASSILNWFQNFNMIDGMAHHSFIDYTLSKMKDPLFSKNMSKLIKEADIGINSIELHEKELPFERLPEEVRQIISSQLKGVEAGGAMIEQAIMTTHTVYDEQDAKVGEAEFNLDRQESKGTVKYFRMLGPVLDTLKKGNILMVDELDSSLHPLLSSKLIEMFQNPDVNVNGAQLIFATHDTNLLNSGLFEREQVWFSEKNEFGSTKIYSLSEIKGVRKTDAFGKQYLMGKYGAIPYLGSFEF
ncbi:abortive infection protein, putative [hydrothermal vent metagenome]|uniref:Abortive infection protein, putative n=1 Tax=hydrothermal vent metagenome TaxID=652676 RepID=A0A3B0WAH9_9ZZZZ